MMLRRVLLLLAVLMPGAPAIADAPGLAPESELRAVFRQMGVPVEGQFVRFSGRIDYDPAAPEAGRAELRIDTRSFDLGLADFNAEAARPEWLDSGTHPEAIYRAEGLTPLGDGRFRTEGRLSLKGRERVLPAEFQIEERDGRRWYRGSVTLNRRDFDIGGRGWEGVVADPVEVRFHLAAPLAGVRSSAPQE